MAPRSTVICAVAMCTKKVRRRAPYCYAHYMKNWRYGSPTPNHITFREDLTGRRFDALLVTGYAGNSFWNCLCDCGASHKRKAGELNRATVATCGNRSVHRRLDWVDYATAHHRVRSDRGSARLHACIDGCGNPALHWSYNYGDPNELIGQDGAGKGCKYSLNTNHYEPRCALCHRRYDIAVASALSPV